MARKEKSTRGRSIRHYFVDEAGDGTLFSGKGRVILGTPGCSRFFILGLLDAPDPLSLTSQLADLRLKLQGDPYFKNVPSMQPGEKKTALAFHAKDDLPEVRREVMAILRLMPGLRFYAVVSDKQRVLEYVQQRNAREPGYRYNPNELYDYLVRRLFKNLLHKDDEYQIVFAKRGKSDRTQALMLALQAARQRFAKQWGIISNAPMVVSAGIPAQSGGLQSADYFLWALQRLYELGEDRYIQYLWQSIHLVHDIDDVHDAAYGVYYGQKKPLTATALHGRLK